MKFNPWKYYFWLILAIDLVGFLAPQNRRVWESIDTGFILLSFAGLFGYCWEKKVFAKIFWQIFVVCFIGWIVTYFFIAPPLPTILLQAQKYKIPFRIFNLLALLPHIPLLIALYFYAYKKLDYWEN